MTTFKVYGRTQLIRLYTNTMHFTRIWTFINFDIHQGFRNESPMESVCTSDCLNWQMTKTRNVDPGYLYSHHRSAMRIERQHLQSETLTNWDLSGIFHYIKYHLQKASNIGNAAGISVFCKQVLMIERILVFKNRSGNYSCSSAFWKQSPHICKNYKF